MARFTQYSAQPSKLGKSIDQCWLLASSLKSQIAALSPLTPLVPSPAGSYTYASITVDAYGRVTAASSGAEAQTLQAAYTAGGAGPQYITLTAAGLGVVVRDAATPIGARLFGATTNAGTELFGVYANKVGLGTNLTFSEADATYTIGIAAPTVEDQDAADLIVSAGSATGTAGAAGHLYLNAGSNAAYVAGSMYLRAGAGSASDGEIILGDTNTNAVRVGGGASAVYLTFGGGTQLSLADITDGYLLRRSAGDIAGLNPASDTFTQYALLAGRAGGQTLKGGSAATDYLKLVSTSGTGTTDYISLCVGTNGGTEGLRVLNSGTVSFKTNATYTHDGTNTVIENLTGNNQTTPSAHVNGIDFSFNNTGGQQHIYMGWRSGTGTEVGADALILNGATALKLRQAGADLLTFSGGVTYVSGTILAPATTATQQLGNLNFGWKELWLQQAGTVTADTSILSLTNSGNAASMANTRTSILWNQWYYDAGTPAVADAASITVGTEGNWTSTASTQDAYMAFSTAVNGTVTEWGRFVSSGWLSLNPSTTPQTALLLDIAATTENTTRNSHSIQWRAHYYPTADADHYYDLRQYIQAVDTSGGVFEVHSLALDGGTPYNLYSFGALIPGGGQLVLSGEVGDWTIQPQQPTAEGVGKGLTINAGERKTSGDNGSLSLGTAHTLAVNIGMSGGTLGFFGATAAAQAAAYTQTYSTATRTVNPTATAAFTSTPGALGDAATLADLNTLRTDMLQMAQLINSLIDDAQGYGLAQ